MIKNLTREDMEKLVNIVEIIDSNEEALKIYSSKMANIPLRTNLDIAPNNGQSLYMPGYAKGENIEALGQKIVSVYPDNPEKYQLPAVPATMLLQDAKTGLVKCLMDGTYLTQLRTGALSGLASKYLSKKDSKRLLQVGVGGQSETQIDAVVAVRDIKEVYVCDLFMDKCRSFADYMSTKYTDIKFIPVENSDDVIPDMDIITLVTTSKNPVIDGKLVSPGTHINSVGSYTPDMQETPVEILQKADKIYFDTYEGVMKESGDVLIPLANGEFTEDRITGELGEYLLGKIKGRENDSEITWFKTTGSAVLDIIAAEKIYQNSQK